MHYLWNHLIKIKALLLLVSRDRNNLSKSLACRKSMFANKNNHNFHLHSLNKIIGASKIVNLIAISLFIKVVFLES